MGRRPPLQVTEKVAPESEPGGTAPGSIAPNQPDLDRTCVLACNLVKNPAPTGNPESKINSFIGPRRLPTAEFFRSK